MKLCIDCRWFLAAFAGPLGTRFAECQHSSALMPQRPPSPVTGGQDKAMRRLCEDHRSAHWSDDPCGPDGKYWEAGERGFS